MSYYKESKKTDIMMHRTFTIQVISLVKDHLLMMMTLKVLEKCINCKITLSKLAGTLFFTCRLVIC